MNLKNAVASANKRILLLGDSGTGKTSFCATMPEPFVADFDNGLTSIIGRDVETEPFHNNPEDPQAYKAFKEYIKQWRVKPLHKTFCVDGLTRLSDAIFSWAMKENGRLGQAATQADWGKAIGEVKKILGFITTLDCNVVVTAHLQAERDELLGGIRYVPLIYGRALPGDIPIYFDEVWMTAVERNSVGGKPQTTYRLQVQPDQKYAMIKSGMNRLGCFEYREEPDFSKLLAKYGKALEQFTQGKK